MKVKHAIKAYFMHLGYGHRKASKLAKGPARTFKDHLEQFSLKEHQVIVVPVSNRIIGAVCWQHTPEGCDFWHNLYTYTALKEDAYASASTE